MSEQFISVLKHWVDVLSRRQGEGVWKTQITSTSNEPTRPPTLPKISDYRLKHANEDRLLFIPNDRVNDGCMHEKGGLVINDGVKTKGSYLSLFFGAFADNTCK